jgi:ATP-dependent DNA helicase RecG
VSRLHPTAPPAIIRSVVPVTPPTPFGESRTITAAELVAAPVRLPRPSRLAAPVEIGPARAAKGASALGLHTAGDLLEHLPFRHEDRREARGIAGLALDEQATIIVEVRSIASRRARNRRLTIQEAVVADETGVIKAVWFNQPWLARQLTAGTRVVLHGRYGGRNQFRVSEHELAAGASASEQHSTGLVPVYPATDGLPATRIRELVWGVRDRLGDVLEPLPAALRAAERLPDRPAALRAMHFPEEEGEEEAGRERLAFDELLLTQLALLRRRARRREAAGAPVLDGPRELTERWLTGSLPFAPTADQERAMAAVEEDLASPRPMQRLLMGEVGSGKTVVALFAMLRAVEHGMQAALMAPTETLAEQHFATIARLMPGEMLQAALLTGSTPAGRRAEILGKLASGELRLLIGTHALIEDAVEFRDLAVAVVDEQHRFGVRQRTALEGKGAATAEGRLSPHVLHMTATPIPRTLALTAYGDLDVTVLKELPAGRRPIETFVAGGERERARAYERMREELRAGRQAFVVCPLVEESEALQARAATAEYERLAATELRDFRVVLLHGQMRPKDKQAAMADFAAGGADVLVATSVIEVGIDVPNATVMLVEDADRYGISQLHQLRGRIGRGEHPSLCLLFGAKESERLRALAEHRDGFKLAEIDLRLRGEGELVGVRQSGLATFKVARLPEDAPLLERARAAAHRLIAEDPQLEHPEHALLGDALVAAFGPEALEPIPA